MKFLIANTVVYIQKCEYPFFELKINKKKFQVKIITVNRDICEYIIKKRKVKFYMVQLEDNLFQIVSGGESFICEVKYILPTISRTDADKKNIIYEVKAPVSGLITKIFVAPNVTVNRGQKLLSLNAMKMENEVQSPVDGKILEIRVSENKEVNKNDTLVVINHIL